MLWELAGRVFVSLAAALLLAVGTALVWLAWSIVLKGVC